MHHLLIKRHACWRCPHVNMPHLTISARFPADFCNFDTGLCHWTNSHADTLDWTRHKGSTPSGSTGPTNDHLNNPNRMKTIKIHLKKYKYCQKLQSYSTHAYVKLSLTITLALTRIPLIIYVRHVCLDYYIYLEASSHTNKVAKLDSQQYPGGDYCIDFYYRCKTHTVLSLSYKHMRFTKCKCTRQ